jgi:SAM-dependent methyltransferase
MEVNVPLNADDVYNDAVKSTSGLILDSMVSAGFNIENFLKERQRISMLNRDLGEFLNEPIESIVKNSFEPEPRLAEQWKSKETTDKFYINNKDYLYDNIKYNQFLSYHFDRLFPFSQIKHLKSLDWGCGIGSLVFLLSHNNISTGYDINPKVIEFADFLKKKYGYHCEFTLNEPDYSQFDLITALGTLEHIEDLESLIKKFAVMKSGSSLVHIDDWGDQTISPMHFNHSGNIDKWLIESGFMIKNERVAVKI